MVAARLIQLSIIPTLSVFVQACSVAKPTSCQADAGIELEITLDSATLYRGVLAACPEMLPDSIRERFTRAVFVFKPARSLQWDEFRTPAGEAIEGNVWRAGADADDVLLGISFMGQGRVLLNTIHIAARDSSTAFPLGAGIRSTTLPNKRLELTPPVVVELHLMNSKARRRSSAASR